MSKLTPNELIEVLGNKSRDDTSFIIGGGPSLKKYLPDPSRIAHKEVIVTNNAYKLFPNAFHAHFADKLWYKWHTTPEQNIFDIYKGTLSTCAHGQKPSWDNDIPICFWKGEAQGGISLKRNTLHGNNAGHHAINIAVLAGYKKIVLLGFDLDATNPVTHWHNEHQQATVVANYTYSMIPGFEKIVPFQDELGFKVYNINRESALKCFDYADLEEFL